MDIVLASKNTAKLAELAAILAEVAPGVRLVEAGWPDVDETGDTFEENALLKAHAAHAASGTMALADDSGIEVDALDGAPGVRSARFAGEDAGDAANLNLLIERMRGVTDRSARFRCVVAIVGEGPDGARVVETAEGCVEGNLRSEPVGDVGFGYDPLFEPLGWDRTFAEVPAAEKATISHRGEALRGAAELLAKMQVTEHPRA